MISLSEPVQHALQVCAFVFGAPRSLLTVLPESTNSPPATAALVPGCSLIRTSQQSISSTSGKEQKGKRKDFKQCLKNNISILPLFHQRRPQGGSGSGVRGCAKGSCSVFTQLRSFFLLGGLGESQVVKNSYTPFSAETLAAVSFYRRHLCCPSPILPRMDVTTSGQR